MKQIVKHLTDDDVDHMIMLKYHRQVVDPHVPAFVSNDTIGKVYGIHGSSVSRLLKTRFEKLNQEIMITRKRRRKEEQLPVRRTYGMRFLTNEQKEYLRNPEILR